MRLPTAGRTKSVLCVFSRRWKTQHKQSTNNKTASGQQNKAQTKNKTTSKTKQQARRRRWRAKNRSKKSTRRNASRRHWRAPSKAQRRGSPFKKLPFKNLNRNKNKNKTKQNKTKERPRRWASPARRHTKKKLKLGRIDRDARSFKRTKPNFFKPYLFVFCCFFFIIYFRMNLFVFVFF